MRIDFDTYHELLDTLLRNKTRTFLTGFGVFWGVFMLVLLTGGGQGLKEMLSSNFDGFATNAAIIWPQPTTLPYHGYKKGRTWQLVTDDIPRLRHLVPELDVISPMLSRWGSTAVWGNHRVSCSTKGVLPDYARVEAPDIRMGRYINDMDIAQRRNVCVIGEKIYKTLFPDGSDPCGQHIRIDSIYYTVVGVDYGKSNMEFNGSAEESVSIPLSLMQQAYNAGNRIDIIAVTVKRGVTVSSISPRIRQTIARSHDVSPDDENGVMVFNTEVLFGLMDNLFKGVDILIWLVGIGTLLAGAIGVSNIMMVTVRERTTEIGIRRAIGATPANILLQILTESLLLTAVAGMSGILFAVVILQMLEMGNTTDGIVEAHFQVGFWTAIGAAMLLALLGLLAGLAPAARAMSIKPVDAMRDE